MNDYNGNSKYESIKVRFEKKICHIQIYRPEANNTINAALIKEMAAVLDKYMNSAKIVILEGLPEVFCFGADFKDLRESRHTGNKQVADPESLYDLWLQLATGPFISISHVQGKVNAGGVGFIAACDIVLCEENAAFSLSELLFGLMPACVLPFLIRRTGYSRAHYMTLMTQPINTEQAKLWGLIDDYKKNSRNLLNRHLLRLTKLSKTGIARYKNYMNELNPFPSGVKLKAVEANRQVFSDKSVLDKIARYVETGRFPWEE